MAKVNTKFDISSFAKEAIKIPRRTRKLFIKPAYKQNPIQEYYDTIFENQKNFGKKIAQLFTNLSLINILAVAPTQSGKTGSMVGVIYEMFNNKILRLPKENIFIFTGHSSIEWINQTKERFPSWLRPHIYHRNNLEIIINNLQNMKNILVIIDECHIACGHNQSLDKLFKRCNYENMDYIYENNIKFVQFTATPEKLDKVFCEKFGSYAHIMTKMDVPNNYLSVKKLDDCERIHKALDLCGIENKETNKVDPLIYENIKQLNPFLEEFEPSYHIIRTPRGYLHDIVIKNFKHVFEKKEYMFLSEPKMTNGEFDTLLKKKPNTHVFIFIKDKLRCAKTIHHEFIGIVYDRIVKKPIESTILQGLLGRMTGYHNNKKALIFTNYDLLTNEDENEDENEDDD